MEPILNLDLLAVLYVLLVGILLMVQFHVLHVLQDLILHLLVQLPVLNALLAVGNLLKVEHLVNYATLEHIVL